MSALLPLDRPALVRRSRQLNYATIAYNSLEGIFAIGAGVVAGSIALVGFGIDSMIEVSAGATALWRLQADADPIRRERVEGVALRLIGVSFLALAAYVSVESLRALASRTAPDRSWFGVLLAVLSLIIMPYLSFAKRTIAVQLQSGALAAEAKQTLICVYLSVILLCGLLLNVLVGWWWADPAAALVMVPLVTWEGIEGLRGRSACGDGC
ncbi:MAG: cation transporter [Gemmatimonadales bacterium]